MEAFYAYLDANRQRINAEFPNVPCTVYHRRVGGVIVRVHSYIDGRDRVHRFEGVDGMRWFFRPHEIPTGVRFIRVYQTPYEMARPITNQEKLIVIGMLTEMIIRGHFPQYTACMWPGCRED